MTRQVLMAGALAAVLCSSGTGQTALEYGAAASARAAGAGSRGPGASAGKIYGRTGEALGAAGRNVVGGPGIAPQSGTSPKVLRVKQRPPVQFRATPEAFAKLEAGLPAAELEKLLGPPSFRVLETAQGKLVELLEYSTGEKLLGAVRVVDGKVAEVRPAGP